MKKVLCIIDSMGSGGAQRQMVGLACLLRTSGYDVRVFWYHQEDFYVDILKSSGVECSNKILKGPALKVIGVFKEIRKFNPDAVISYLDGPCIIACFCKFIGLRFKLIVSERNTTQNLSIKERFKFRLYRFADFIVPNSLSQKKYIEANFPDISKKIRTITNFVDVDKFQPMPLDRSVDGIRMVVVARLVEQKNVIGFVRAVGMVVETGVPLRVDWYGVPFGDKYFNRCLRTVDDLGLNNVISFKGEVKDIVSVYRSADVFCLPSLYEGFPNTLCEAMSCGIPILCSNVCDNPFIVDGDVNAFLFDPESVVSMAETILRFCKLSVEERTEMGSKSRQIAMRSFSQDFFIQEYISIL